MTINLEPGAPQSKILQEMKRIARAEARTQDVSSSFDKLFDFEVSWRKLKLMDEEGERRKEMGIAPGKFLCVPVNGLVMLILNAFSAKNGLPPI
jgi:hypothetical protein